MIANCSLAIENKQSKLQIGKRSLSVPGKSENRHFFHKEFTGFYRLFRIQLARCESTYA